MALQRLFLLPFCLLCLSLGGLSAQATSFDCGKAVTAVEKAICASPELSTLDETAAHYYREALSTLPWAKACLLADQRAWLKTVRNRCADEACLKAAYLDRLAELDKVQPARKVGEPMPLPARAYLVGIIAPTTEKPAPVESDPAGAAPLDVTGTLAEGEGGLVLTTADGRAYALMTWYVDPAALDQLKAAMLSKGARFAVRGFAGRNSASGQTYVEPRRCIYVYQAPGP